MNLFFLNINEIKGLELDPEIISAERRRKSRRFKLEKARQLSFCAEIALIAALCEYNNDDELIISAGAEKAQRAISNMKGLPLDIVAGERGKPFFAPESPFAGKIFFNMSHAGDWAVAAAASCPVGIDIELIRENDPKYPDKILHEKEYNIYNSIKDPGDKKKYFYECWVKKESYLKMSGLGLGVMPRDFLADGENFETVPGSEAEKYLEPGFPRILTEKDPLPEEILNKNFLEYYCCAFCI